MKNDVDIDETEGSCKGGYGRKSIEICMDRPIVLYGDCVVWKGLKGLATIGWFV